MDGWGNERGWKEKCVCAERGFETKDRERERERERERARTILASLRRPGRKK